MASLRRRAFLQAQTQIDDAAGGPAGLTSSTGRSRAVEDEELPHVLLYMAPEQPEPADHGDQGAGPILERVFRFRTEFRVKAPEGQDPGDLLDAVYVHVAKAIMGDHTLGGLVQEVEEGATVPEIVEVSWPYGNMAVEWVATLYTPRDDPEVNANV